MFPVGRRHLVVWLLESIRQRGQRLLTGFLEAS